MLCSLQDRSRPCLDALALDTGHGVSERLRRLRGPFWPPVRTPLMTLTRLIEGHGFLRPDDPAPSGAETENGVAPLRERPCDERVRHRTSSAVAGGVGVGSTGGVSPGRSHERHIYPSLAEAAELGHPSDRSVRRTAVIPESREDGHSAVTARSAGLQLATGHDPRPRGGGLPVRFVRWAHRERFGRTCLLRSSTMRTW